jgi:enoyl-CoA hydratase/carnithine racemase
VKHAIEVAVGLLDEAGKGLRTAFEKESRLSSAIFQTEDAKEGPKAFAEKRPPVWQAR